MWGRCGGDVAVMWGRCGGEVDVGAFDDYAACLHSIIPAQKCPAAL
ncbi:hypothetical protein [Paenibacillus jilunlii]|nr:hypothetical protein [Paenibacillus jilunlii]